ncbi:MAG TPA: RidA family protein [Acidimicrobiia bacterium]|nr:RidA family protein [Acidimicrobiia bacterium]
MGADARIKELGLELPEPQSPVANYVSAVRAGDLLFLAGHGPLSYDGKIVLGKVGSDLDVAAGAEAARLCGMGLLAAMRAELGSLDRVVRMVKLLVMVNCAPGFNDTPTVANGCSDLMVEVFGDTGRHARSAVGMAELPFDIAVEIEAVVQVA